MTLKLFHTSDNHIGMTFSGYPDSVREKLVASRIETLSNMVEYANGERAELFVVAGDLFNSQNVTNRDIMATAEVLRAFSGLCLVLPGNHDYYSGVERLWSSFEKYMGSEIILLKEQRQYDLRPLGLEAVIYPAHCHDKHSSKNSLEWIKKTGILDEAHTIGVAHGAIEGLSPDLAGEYYFMTKAELTSIPVDLWLLGHTHVPYPISGSPGEDRIYNAGTHEPDGMNYRYEGSGFLIELDDENRLSSKRVISGKHRFKELSIKIENEQSLSSLRDLVVSEMDQNTLMRLKLSGYIGRECYESRSELFREIERSCLSLEVYDEELRLAITPEDIGENFMTGSFPYRFLNELIGDEDALQLAYELVERSRRER